MPRWWYWTESLEPIEKLKTLWNRVFAGNDGEQKKNICPYHAEIPPPPLMERMFAPPEDSKGNPMPWRALNTMDAGAPENIQTQLLDSMPYTEKELDMETGEYRTVWKEQPASLVPLLYKNNPGAILRHSVCRYEPSFCRKHTEKYGNFDWSLFSAEEYFITPPSNAPPS